MKCENCKTGTVANPETVGEKWCDLCLQKAGMWQGPRWEKRADNREQSTRILRDEGIQFEAKNKGAHLIVGSRTEVIDFWPGTGKWIARRSKRDGRGVRNLLKYLRGTS